MQNGTNGKWSFPFVSCKWKMETINFHLFAANGNRTLKFVFLGRQTLNGIYSTIAVSANVPIYQYSHLRLLVWPANNDQLNLNLVGGGGKVHFLVCTPKVKMKKIVRDERKLIFYFKCKKVQIKDCFKLKTFWFQTSSSPTVRDRG